jgi:hypothetical protein
MISNLVSLLSNTLTASSALFKSVKSNCKNTTLPFASGTSSSSLLIASSAREAVRHAMYTYGRVRNSARDGTGERTFALCLRSSRVVMYPIPVFPLSPPHQYYPTIPSDRALAHPVTIATYQAACQFSVNSRRRKTHLACEIWDTSVAVPRTREDGEACGACHLGEERGHGEEQMWGTESGPVRFWIEVGDAGG